MEELWVVDPLERSVRIWHLQDGVYAETGRSALLGLDADAVRRTVEWPPA